MPRRKRLTILALILALTLFGWISSGPLGRLANAEARPEYKELELFTDVLSIVRKSYVEEVKLKDLIYGAINGMLATLDPHSSFMPPEVFQERKIDTRGEFGGLGIEITIRDGLLTIVSPIEDTPAYRVGLQAGDQILKIEDRFTKDLSIMDAVKLMRGPAGTKISITVLRESFDKPREFTLKREVIKIKSVKSRILEPGYGYVRVSQFQERTSEDLLAALEALRKESPAELSGLVLDLRNNPGGLLDQAVKVSDVFLDTGLIVYTEGREPGSRMSFSAHEKGSEPDYPMVVLINAGSASASEIVAGALQDHQRAVVMGVQSFGKGSVQTLLPLGDNSGLSLTTARYFTPKGTSIQATGITPDIVVRQLEFRESREADHFREKDLEKHIETPAGKGPAPSNGEPKETRLGDGDREDYQLLRALDLLKGWQIFHSLQKQAA